jgi:hypothetical protein
VDHRGLDNSGAIARFEVRKLPSGPRYFNTNTLSEGTSLSDGSRNVLASEWGLAMYSRRNAVEIAG